MAGDTTTTKAATTTTSVRTTRFASSRSATRSYNIEPAPIILEIQSSIIRVGYAEQCSPQHIIKMDTPLFEGTENNDNGGANNLIITKSESEWYMLLSPIIERIYDRLMCKPSTRRVVLLYKPYAPTTFQVSLRQHLWNRGAPAIVELNTLQTIPITQGWKRGLIVHVEREEIICVCHCDGYIIPYTYQFVQTGYKYLLLEEEETQGNNIII